VIVLFDSGVWISAISRRGIPLSAITHGLDKDEVLTCVELEDEIGRIMDKKFGVNPEAMRQQLGELLEKSIRIAVPGL
jgi:hypothetical protein